ncbi:MAG: efflux RND transporter permease subunit [Pseudomonadota bacterium]
MTGGILSYFTRHPTAANLLLVVVVVLGLAATPQMRAQFFPDVVVDEIDVRVTWEGAGSEDVDRAIIEPMLPTLMAVEGINSSSSRAREGNALMELEFEPGWDMDRAMSDIQAAVDSINTLPEDADTPTVRRSAWRDRVTDVVITGPVGVDQLGRFADEFTARLFREGVTRTTVRGFASPETVVEVRTLDLIRHDVTMAELARVIEEAADSNPAGDIEGANARVRTGSERRSAEEVAALPVRVFDDGSVLTIGDVGSVFEPGIDRQRAYYVGGNPALSVRVDRSPQGDAIDIQRKVEDVAAEMELTLPTGVEIDLIRTRAENISARLTLLLDSAAVGLALVVGLLFLFLNARTALWVAAGIPVALITALGMMYLGGLTINMISLFGLIITLGIVVDDAIVVGEHADYRFRTLGEPPVVAAETAARRMFLPVLSATLTTIIAFWGLSLIGGRFGTLIQDIPFTVIAVLAASLVECFLILPNHMAHALKAQATVAWYDLPSFHVNRGFNWVRENLFRPFVGVILRLRYATVAGALVLLASQVAPVITEDLRFRFFVSPEQSSISGNFAMLPDATREDTLAQMQELERATRAVAARLETEHGVNPVAYILSEVGGNTGRGLSGTESTDRDLLGSVAIELIDAEDRPFSSSFFVSALQDETQRLPLTETLSFRSWRFGGNDANLEVGVYGADLRTLKAAAEDLKTRLAQYGEISSIEDNLSYDKDEYVLELTPQGRALGFTIDGLGQVLRHRLAGIEAATYPSGLRSGAIRVELTASERSADFLDAMMLRAASGQYVPLTDIVTVTRSSGFGTIRRENGLAVVTVSGEISEDDQDRAAEIEAELKSTILPSFAEEMQVEYKFTGRSEEESRFIEDAQTGFFLCLVGIFLTLAWIFASWTRPFAIMAVIPFGMVGAFWGHQQWDVPLSMFSIIGLIGMTGIIINDSIVLISTIDERAKTRGLWPAIIDGTAERLRPVILTTLTTVLGLVPLLYEGSRQAEFLKPTIITLVYGLGFGMFLVLILVPALLAIGQDISGSLRSMRRGIFHGGARVRLVAGTYAFVTAGLFAATLGTRFVSGDLAVLDRVPALSDVSHELPVALAVFAVGASAFGGLLLLIVSFMQRERPQVPAE